MRDRRRFTRAPEESEFDFFISVSDLLSSLIFIFIIALLIFAARMGGAQDTFRSELKKTNQERVKLEQINLQREQELRTQAAVVDKVKNLSQTLRQNINSYLSEKDNLQVQLLVDLRNDLVTQEHLSIFIDAVQGILRLPDEILFPFGSADLTTEGKNNLRKLANALERHLPCYAGSSTDQPRLPFCSDREWHPGTLDSVFIEGHTDNVQVGRANVYQSNLQLSGMRAIRTFETILQDVDLRILGELSSLRNQKQQPIFGVSGYGQHRPVVLHEQPTNEPANRRIEMRFIMTNSRLPEVIPKIFNELDQVSLNLHDVQ